MFQSVPQSEEILMQRANALAGMTLTNLANKCEFTLPNSVLHAKGWVGQLLEHALGATSGSKPQPDFPKLSIELKSIPVTSQGTPKESTYICVVQLSPYDQANWEQSLVRKNYLRYFGYLMRLMTKFLLQQGALAHPYYGRHLHASYNNLKQTGKNSVI